MHTLLLEPTDVLFFRDGRPMDASSSGHGAAWPLPHVINAAFHAALHRADIEAVHTHRSGRSSQRDPSADRDRKFGSLRTVGPFPVSPNGRWYFPRPADAPSAGSFEPSLHPLDSTQNRPSSLPKHLMPLVNSRPPTKTKAEKWLSSEAYAAYLNPASRPNLLSGELHYLDDADFSDVEHQIGIGIDPERGSTEDGQFYSAQYLRLRPDWQLGLCVSAHDKVAQDPGRTRNLIQELIDCEGHLLVGGQQRVCTAKRCELTALPLPRAPQVSGTRVKWTLLTPAIFPQIGEHPGGWLPSWIAHESRQVQLLDGPGKNKARKLRCPPGQPIMAKLVAAIIPGSQAVTGFASTGKETGAKSTHLAVPAGSVYYFEAADPEQARKLATALNWHGPENHPTQISHARSTLFGEKGFGLGLCSEWQPHQLTFHDTTSTNP